MDGLVFEPWSSGAGIDHYTYCAKALHTFLFKRQLVGNREYSLTLYLSGSITVWLPSISLLLFQ